MCSLPRSPGAQSNRPHTLTCLSDYGFGGEGGGRGALQSIKPELMRQLGRTISCKTQMKMH